MANAIELLEEWLNSAEDAEVQAELRSLKDAGDEAAINDAFFQDLEFGTAGLRGIIGAGTNRMNIYTVGRATQGFANYLNEHFENPTVAIARDSRNKGDLFVQVAASVLAANGIVAYVYPRIEPTPALSWAVRDLGCSGGICMTASHNPAPYNGYKAYGPDGCQITTEAARAISQAIEQVDAFADVKRVDFEAAATAGNIRWIDEAVLDRFIDAVVAQSVEPGQNAVAPTAAADASARERGASANENTVFSAVAENAGAASANLKLVYTPLNGTGLECVGRMLDRIGITDVTVVPEQAQPDGNFPTCPYPNPEIREALQKGIDLCEQVEPDLLLATDPDADRVGIAVKDDGAYVLLSGNEVGVLLLDYVARKRIARGENVERGLAVTTIVSSVMVDAIAAEYGFEVRRVLTGFKYIGEVIGQLEAVGEEARFLFGFEESYGYLSGPHVRDKDAINASMLICQMAQDYKRRGMNLAQAMKALYEKHGYFHNKTVSLEYPGAEGSQRMAALMAALRESVPSEIGGYAVERVVDYAPGVAGLPAANVVEFNLAEGNKVIVRPSGTEPKIKLYLFAKGATADAANSILAQLEKAGHALLS